MKNKQLILFDLDGTLTDPKEGITKSFRFALEKLGYPEEDLDELEKVIGPPLWDSFQDYYGMTREQADLGVQYYRERYRDVGKFENILIEGIPELLWELKAAGKQLALATSKPTDYSIEILQHFEIDQPFDQMIGSNLDGTRINKDESIQHVLSLFDIPAENIVMIGDRKHDIIGAKAHGIDSIGVLFGYGSRQEFEQHGATIIVETVDELKQVLLGS
ncbi:MAG: HAD family hydrolase [Tissierellia bacterium]|nr:HAD family hydrolase [Tissierellia bacterium]